MHCVLMYAVAAVLTLQIISAAPLMCPSDPNCVCGGTLAIELDCNIDGRIVKINLLPNIYLNIKCENITSLDYNKLPKCAKNMSSFNSVSFKDCPLPSSSFNDVLMKLGISKTMALIFQNAKNLSGYIDRKHFAGLQDLTKLLLSINGITHLPNNLFMDIKKLTWLNIRSNTINLSEEIFKPLERLETLEISHNHMTNISSNLFSHLSFLRKLSLWQSNVTWFSKDLFTGVDVLEELDLSSNGLNELPASIFKPLKKLKKLTLFSNKFSSVPQNLFISNKKLETVVILNNDVKMKSLPKNLFGDLPNLKLVHIQKSGLETLPYDVFANSAQITNISLAHNDITVLPESIFNDQINLLELDLSSNKLSELKPKLFSSLVRLESLNLCSNSILEISGETFSSLLSLMYLNMAENRLRKISSYLFSNNKQRMSISLAYNDLDFEERELSNNFWIVKRSSPFAHTYNLKLLNLSHNNFKVAFKDWWMNGHENLDIRNNYILNLWVDGNSYQNKLKQATKNVWISHNPIPWNCYTFCFLDYIKNNLKTKIVDFQQLDCPSLLLKLACYDTVLNALLLLLILGLVIVAPLAYQYIKYKIKKRFNTNVQNYTLHKFKKHNIRIRYCDKDKEFVEKEILPAIKCNNSRNMSNLIWNFTCCIKGMRESTTLIVFSSNYLTTNYCHVDIKKIHGKMLNTENTIYVFIDVGPENSIYSFLKEQRDVTTTIVWKEPHFWEKFFEIISNKSAKEKRVAIYELPRSKQNFNAKIKRNPIYHSQNFLNDNMYDWHTLTHSQV